MALELSPGTKLYGFCNGYFGRDSYAEKTVIASGTWGSVNWVVVTTREFRQNVLLMATGFDEGDIERWKIDAEEGEDWDGDFPWAK